MVVNIANRQEIIEYNKKILAGEDVSDFKFSGEVKELPDNFKEWVENNQERIEKAKSTPYFLKDNHVVERQHIAASFNKITGGNTTFDAFKFDGEAVLLTAEQHKMLYEANISGLTAQEDKQAWAHGLWDERTQSFPLGYIEKTRNSMKLNYFFRSESKALAMDAQQIKTSGIFNGKQWTDRETNKKRGIVDDDYNTIAALDKATRNNKGLPFPIKVFRNVTTDGAKALTGYKGDGGIEEIGIFITNRGKGLSFVDNAYLSTSTNKSKNIFQEYNVQLEITIPKHKPLYITRNYNESEAILQRGSVMMINGKIRKEKGKLIIPVVIS